MMSIDQMGVDLGARPHAVLDLDAMTLTTTARVVRTVVVVADDSAVRHGCGAVLPSYFAGHHPRCPRCGQTA